jgi:hypothetical protein
MARITNCYFAPNAEVIFMEKMPGKHIFILLSVIEEIIKAQKEMQITAEKEKTERFKISCKHQEIMRILDVVEEVMNKVLTYKLEVHRQAIMKELEIIQRALDESNIKNLHLGLSALINTLSLPLMEEMKQIDNAISKAITGEGFIEL